MTFLLGCLFGATSMAHQTEKLRLLHESVERCHRLARGMSDIITAARLNALAQEAEAEIVVLEDGMRQQSAAVRRI